MYAVDEPPPRELDPLHCRTFDDVAEVLRALRRDADNLPFRLLAERVNSRRLAERRPAVAVSTVFESFKDGRRRMDRDLVLDLASALGMTHEQLLRLEQACLIVGRWALETERADVRDRLPAPRAEFAGRAEPMEQAAASVRAAAARGAPPRLAVTGPAGIGKTEFALQLAHRAEERGYFGEPVLFADLHGFDERQPPADPEAVLAGFASLLGLPRREVAGLRGLRGKRERVRSELRGRRALVILDNAADVEQVAPLLPAGPEQLAVITSRSRLDGLPDAEHIALDALNATAGVELLRGFDRGGRVDAEPAVAARLAQDVCYGVPYDLLALAAQLAEREKSHWTLSDHEARLARFPADEISRPALAASTDGLSGVARKVFRLSAAIPANEFSAHEAAILADVPHPDAQAALDQLHDRHLLNRPRIGRFRFHDITRAHAGWLLVREEPASGVHAALKRLEEADTRRLGDGTTL